MLNNKKGLIIGVANEHSLAWGCARAFHQQSATLALTYLNDKARPHVEPLAQQVAAPILLPLDVRSDTQWDVLFETIEKEWGTLDFAVHSIAFAPKDDLHGRVVDCSPEGFSQAMNISCHSFLRMAKLCEPLMNAGGSLLTMSYYGAQKVMDNYLMMGPVKAALEACVREVAVELGGKHIRANAISAGPVQTRAASGLLKFDQLMDKAETQAPLQQLIGIDDVGGLAAYLVSDQAKCITGQTLFVDAGYSVMGV
ncbi:MAG: enoyl-ACP reductase FabI [Thiotrichales bacterium]|nr:enoyl-ACP reductase FabI [Thiotrichales bacterium]